MHILGCWNDNKIIHPCMRFGLSEISGIHIDEGRINYYRCTQGLFSRGRTSKLLCRTLVSSYTNLQHNARHNFQYFIFILFLKAPDTEIQQLPSACCCHLLSVIRSPSVCLLQVSRPQKISSEATQRGTGNQSVTGGDATTQHRTFVTSSGHLLHSSPVDSPGRNIIIIPPLI